MMRQSQAFIDEQYEQSLTARIKAFLVKDSSFRDPDFDPAPYLIKLLKIKEANQQLLIAKQEQLIEMENEAQQLIIEIIKQNQSQLLELLQMPQKYGEHLQKLKHKMTNVKKKIKQTKMYLSSTQRDIQQIHLNCMFNQIVCKKLKEVQQKINNYETAALALKNNLYLECSQHLPEFSGETVLESALAVRSENLKLRYVSQAIEQIRVFLYFTTRIMLPSSYLLIEKNQSQANASMHNSQQKFYKRYQQFKQVKCESYVQEIWQFGDLERKAGRIGVIYEIIKGVMRIGKIGEIREFLNADYLNSIKNIFLALSLFFAREMKEQSEQPKQTSTRVRWFTNPSHQSHSTFISTVLTISAALLRKIIIIRRICKQYQIDGLKLHSGQIFRIISDQICQLVKLIYFPEQVPTYSGSERIQEEILAKVQSKENYIMWPYFKGVIEKVFVVLAKNLNFIQAQYLEKEFNDKNSFEKFAKLQPQFFKAFHEDFTKTLTEFFSKEGKSFNVQTFEHIVQVRVIANDEQQFCEMYNSIDKKAFKEHISLISLLNSLRLYFKGNGFQHQKHKKYATFALLYFYLRLNHHMFRNQIPLGLIDRIVEQRRTDPKIREKEKALEMSYYMLIEPKTEVKGKVIKKANKADESMIGPKSIDKLRIFKSQNAMVLNYCCKEFRAVEQVKKNQNVSFYQGEIEKFESQNYLTNISPKLVRIWEAIPDGELQLSEMQAAIFRKFIEMHEIVMADIYIESGTFE